MRRFLSILAFLAAAGCSSNPNTGLNVSAPADITGKAKVGPVSVGGVALTPAYQIDGHATAFFQFPNKPHLTLDGDYTTTVTQMPGASGEATNPENVLIRLPNGALQAPNCSTGSCAPPTHPAAAACLSTKWVNAPTSTAPSTVPTAAVTWAAAPACAPAAPAAPLPCSFAAPAAATDLLGNACGQPVYRGCDGKVGGHSPNDPMPDAKPKVFWSPFSDCGVPKPALGETCPHGIGAIFQGIADLFSGKIL